MNAMNKKIYISGMHSGQNPCPGGGIAQCLRKAFPSAKLFGVDHWQGSSGLHDEVLDEVLLLPQWKQIDNKRHAEYISSLLEENHLWFSSLDMEVHWLTENIGQHRNLLAPSAKAIELTAKPEVKAFDVMGFRVPEFISIDYSDTEIHSFLRHHSWQCWLKSPYHEAKRISSWDKFERTREVMMKNWKTSRLFLQQHIIGNEEAICFAAYQGKLLQAIHLEKRQITSEGKTWAGKIMPLDSELFSRIEEVVRRLEWSGGGEIEFTRDPDGIKWMIECNPRFPAWIFGAALTGMNLPAQIVAHVWGIPLTESLSKYPFFTRVVREIPAKESVGIPLAPDPSLMVWQSEESKGKSSPMQPASLPKLKDSLNDEEENEMDSLSSSVPEPIPLEYLNDIKNTIKSFTGETPVRRTLKKWTFSRFENLANKVLATRSKVPEVRIAYSVKTSATDLHLQAAMQQNFFVECISQMEVRRALNFAFPENRIILNGPGKFWPLSKKPVTGLHMLFCDSIAEFNRVVEMPDLTDSLGFRLQLPNLPSRFGVPLDDFDEFQMILSSIRKLKKNTLAFHFHMPSCSIGMQRWMECFHSFLIWCQSLQQLSKVSIKYLDLGGGFFPSDLEKLNFLMLQDTVNQILPDVKAIYFEPGRALTQESDIVISRILDVRKCNKDKKIDSVIVDACIAELPLIRSYSHRVFFQAISKISNATPLLLNKGKTKILGRICMEDDVLSKGVSFPENIEIGDLLIFGDAGAYERSMSYDFGHGR